MIYDSREIEIIQNGTYAGSGIITPHGCIECPANLGPHSPGDPDNIDEAFGASERAYECIEDAIMQGYEKTEVDGITYTWTITEGEA